MRINSRIALDPINYRHLSYREIDAGRVWFGLKFSCMLGIVRPSIPLNPPYRLALVLDNEYMSRLNAVYAAPIFLFKAGEIECVVPPRVDMWLREPPLQQWKVGPFKSAE